MTSHDKYMGFLETWKDHDLNFMVLKRIFDEAYLGKQQGGGINYEHMFTILEEEIAHTGYYVRD